MRNRSHRNPAAGAIDQIARRRRQKTPHDARARNAFADSVGRDYELQDVLDDVDARLKSIENIRTREHDDHLAVIQAIAAPYALALVHEIHRLDELVIGLRRRDKAAEPRSMKRPDVLSNLRAIRGQAVGRPVKHTEPWSKITLMLQDSHAAYLDQLRVTIRQERRKAISRAELIRGFVEFMMQSEIDFSRFASTREMTEFLTQYFRGLARRPKLARTRTARAEPEQQEVAATA